MIAPLGGPPAIAPAPAMASSPSIGKTFADILSSLRSAPPRPHPQAGGAPGPGGGALRFRPDDAAETAPPPGAGPPALASAPASAPLRAGDGQILTSQQAFAFSELGVLGLSGPAAAASMGLSPANAPSSPAAAAAGASQPAALDGLAAPATALVGASAALWPGEAVGSPAQANELADEMASEEPLATPPRALAAAVQDTDENATAELSATPPTGRELPAKAVSAAAVSVAVSSDGESIQVVSASPEITTEARGRLFEAVAKVGEEFGLGLSNLRHNGVSIGLRSNTQGGRVR